MSQTQQLTLRIPSHLHKALKLASANEERSIQDIAIEALTAAVSGQQRQGLRSFFALRDQLRGEAAPNELQIERADLEMPDGNIFGVHQ
jgi:plasmid stability protein